MILEELQERYGPYVAERIRQAMTLQSFRELEIEEVVAHFELLAELTYGQYRVRVSLPAPEGTPVSSKEEYLKILHRRWQEAEEIAHLVLRAEEEAQRKEQNGQQIA